MEPPACNTGVHPPSAPVSAFAPDFRWDWYRATVPAHHERVLEAVLSLAGRYPVVEEGPGRFNYKHSLTVTSGRDRVATVLHGGSNGHPNVEASGERAQSLADLLRVMGPHRVTRADSCRDVYGDREFERADDLALRIASDFDLAHKRITNRDPSAGNTIYLGSRKSALSVRIYEKGKADSRVYGDLPSCALEPWVRYELEVKPQKDMKALAANLSPEAVWGCSEWTATLVSEAFDMAPPAPIDFHPRRMSSDDRAFAFMCAQYRNLLRRRADERHGGDRMALALEIVEAVYSDCAVGTKAAA